MAPGEWLNDEMVNFTIGGMADRERARRGAEQPRVHFFNTFFVNKLCDGQDGYNYNAVRRWTTKKKLGYDLLACDKVIIPVHQGIHWVLAVIDWRRALSASTKKKKKRPGPRRGPQAVGRDEYKNKRRRTWTQRLGSGDAEGYPEADERVRLRRPGSSTPTSSPGRAPLIHQSDMGHAEEIIADAARGRSLGTKRKVRGRNEGWVPPGSSEGSSRVNGRRARGGKIEPRLRPHATVSRDVRRSRRARSCLAPPPTRPPTPDPRHAPSRCSWATRLFFNPGWSPRGDGEFPPNPRTSRGCAFASSSRAPASSGPSPRPLLRRVPVRDEFLAVREAQYPATPSLNACHAMNAPKSTSRKCPSGSEGRSWRPDAFSRANGRRGGKEFAREPTSAPDARATRREARERTRPIPDPDRARAARDPIGRDDLPERPPARPPQRRARARKPPPPASTPTVAISFYSKMPASSDHDAFELFKRISARAAHCADDDARRETLLYKNVLFHPPPVFSSPSSRPCLRPHPARARPSPARSPRRLRATRRLARRPRLPGRDANLRVARAHGARAAVAGAARRSGGPAGAPPRTDP